MHWLRPSRQEVVIIGAVIMAMATTWTMIKIDEACAYHPRGNFVCDVAHGFVRMVAPQAR